MEGVKSVFLGPDFITVTKQDDDTIDWKTLKPEVKHLILSIYFYVYYSDYF